MQTAWRAKEWISFKVDDKPFYHHQSEMPSGLNTLFWIQMGLMEDDFCKHFKELSGEMRQFLWPLINSIEYNSVDWSQAMSGSILVDISTCQKAIFMASDSRTAALQYWSTIDNTWTLCYLLTLNLLIKLLTDIICMFCHWQSCSLH